MPDYDVTIKATVIKTIRVEDAEDEDDATQQAHSMFTTAPDADGQPEKYDEQTVDCVEVE